VHILALAGILVCVEDRVKDVDIRSAILPTDEILNELEVQSMNDQPYVLSDDLLGIRF
jgi:hypothetical protein